MTLAVPCEKLETTTRFVLTVGSDTTRRSRLRKWETQPARHPDRRVALEHEDDVASGKIETAHSDYLGSQDTFYVGTLTGVGWIYQQTFVDTFSKVCCAKLYTTKTPIMAADLLNDKVLPLLEEHGLPMLLILTDCGTEYCGRPERHDYQLYLSVNDIEHTKTKAKSPQTNGICERFHRTILQEFYQVAFRKAVFEAINQLQKKLETWIDFHNTERTHQGRMCCGRTPLATLIDGKTAWAEKPAIVRSGREFYKLLDRVSRVPFSNS